MYTLHILEMNARDCVITKFYNKLKTGLYVDTKFNITN